ncbi:hypothetical protein MMC17_004535 [Xylographa soralifera]|nr:hypothetical protein [Xylographa soralifera]
MPPNDTAAWQIAAKAQPFEIKSAPYTSPREDEIVVKNHAMAINPVDWVVQAVDLFKMSYPAILGMDLAGEVVETYTVVLDRLACKIPSTMSFEQAVVIPLGLCTAASGMSQEDYLKLHHPSLDPKPTGKILIVWGEASSVGSNVIQLGVAAGYEVITTASPKNFECLKKLGAGQVFDYNSKTTVDELIAANKDKSTAGVFDCIGVKGAIQACAETLLRCEGNRFIATCMPPPEDFSPAGISHKFVSGSSLEDNYVGRLIFEDFLPQALAKDKFIAAPDPHVVGKGLGYVQGGLDVSRKGVSAQKIVESL